MVRIPSRLVSIPLGEGERGQNFSGRWCIVRIPLKAGRTSLVMAGIVRIPLEGARIGHISSWSGRNWLVLI